MSKYTLKDLLLIGIKSEIEAEKVYRSTANKAKNPFLKAKLNALAEEENNHKKILEELFHELYPREDIKLPENPEFLPEFPEIKIFAELNGVVSRNNFTFQGTTPHTQKFSQEEAFARTLPQVFLRYQNPGSYVAYHSCTTL